MWLSDLHQAFALVLVESETDDVRLGGVAHLGIACANRSEVDRRSARAKRAGRLLREPEDGGKPVGYWALLRDPDGHNVELSFGQDVGTEVRRVATRRKAPNGIRATNWG